jgi:DnaK suppressor protein
MRDVYGAWRMDKKHLANFKKRLAAREVELRAIATRTSEEGCAVELRAPDVSDRATGSYEKEFAFGQNTNVHELLRLNEEALGRIVDGSFGHCVLCEKEISPKRLDAVPWARYCLDCQQGLEGH